ncbi:MAG TPA: beta-ketoacyl synthase chain length factor [Polyangiales bacterium]
MKLQVLGSGYVLPAADEKLELALLERTLRRGLSELTKLFMHAAKLALDDAQVAATSAQVVFASAFGEIAVAEALLAEAYERDASSPARFRNSVHNTAPGLLSISQRDTAPSTAIAAGWDTVAMGLLEASAQLASGIERVLLVFADERIPRVFGDECTHAAMAVAFVLAREGGRAQLRAPRRCAAPHALDAHPLAGALALARAVEQRRAGTLTLSDGASPWCVDVEFPR